MHLSYLKNIVMVFAMVIGLFAPTSANAIVRNVEFFGARIDNISIDDFYETFGLTDPRDYNSLQVSFSFDTERSVSQGVNTTFTPLSSYEAVILGGFLSSEGDGGGIKIVRDASGLIRQFEVTAQLSFEGLLVETVLSVIQGPLNAISTFDFSPDLGFYNLFLNDPSPSGFNEQTVFPSLSFREDPSTPSPTPPSPAVVPLPAALPLFGTGLAIMGLIGWRRKRKTAAAV